MVFIPDIKTTVVIGGSDPSSYGSYLTQIAMFSHDNNIWIDAGQLNEASFVSLFCHFYKLTLKGTSGRVACCRAV